VAREDSGGGVDSGLPWRRNPCRPANWRRRPQVLGQMSAVSAVDPPGGAGQDGSNIPFIDDSGSSCASSMMGEEDDTASLSRLLDDAASRELSINGLHDDLASLSCGYASLDAHSDAHSDAPSDAHSDAHSRSDVGSSGESQEKSRTGSGRWSWQQSSPGSRRTSKSSIKSTDNLYEEPADNEDNDEKPRPALPPSLPPCDTCEDRSSTSSSCFTGTSSSVLSCTTCAAESDARPEADPPSGTRSVDPIRDNPTQPNNPSNPAGNQNSPPTNAQMPESSKSEMLLSNGQMTPNRLSLTVKEVWSPGGEIPVPLVASTPQPGGSGGAEAKYITPHHYISSMRVASMRGAADMGGALVARVATFLRTQYKNLISTPLQLPWCPSFKMLVSNFETSLLQVPLAPHLKVPPGLLTIPNILQPHQSTVGDRPKRVLVEGDSGYGISTLALKLAYDWAFDPTGSYLSSYSLVFVLTLRDFRGGCLFSYLCKEILPRHILSKEAMNTLWNHMKKIEDKVLFLIVGYDELSEEESGDINELVEGQMFANSTFVITSRRGSSKPIPPVLHRRLFIAGLSPDQTHRFISRYFEAINKPGSGSEDFGKMALEALKTNVSYFTGQDLKTKCQHGGDLVIDLGILLRMQSMSKLTKKDHYTPVHKSFLEFLGAFYLSGLIHDTSLLQAEIDNIAEKLDITHPVLSHNSGLMVLKYLVGLLGRNAHIIFNIVSQMAVPQRILFLLLKESGMYQMNVLEVCKHVSGREHVVIQTNSGELEDWGRLLYSPDCMLEGVEVLLDFDGNSKDKHESFFTSMSFNESVKSVKLTCVVGGDFGETEVTRLVSYVRAVLTKRRLESFEIQVTSLEEATAEILSPVVEMICDTLPDLAQALNKLVVALELDGKQVMQLCQVLQMAPQVRVLHLPHLACGLEGLKAVAQLVENNPLVSLNLAGSLSSGTPVDERSTGTGASTPSPTREDAPAPLSFWSFTDAQGNTRSVFNSLPRSFYQSLPRRGRLHSLSAEKRNSDTTLLQKTSFPPPACSPLVHSNGFHEIFSAFRNPSSRVCHLNISKCTMGAEDLVCLGETVRFTKCLSSLRMEGLSRMAEIIPVLIALQENTSLQLLDLTSPHILLGDAALHVTLNALARNKSLRFLVLNGWTIQVESERSLKELIQFLTVTELQHLDLGSCQVMVTVHDGPLARLSRQDDVIAALQEGVPPLQNSTLAFMNLDNFEVTLNNKVVLRGPQLLFLLRHFPKLVDVSLTSSLGADVIDDATTHRLFSLLPGSFPFLRRLTLGGWVFSLDNCEKVMRAGGRQLRGSQLREVLLGGVEVRESSGKPGMEHTLLQALTTNLHHLSLLSLAGLKLTPTQSALFGKLETRGLGYAAIKALRQALTDGGKFEFEFLGGPSGTYKLKKIDRREKLIGKWACISTLDRLSEL
ncbi:NLR family CARD domain-containing protein 4-like 3, partial [Homarus americanus]